VVSFVCFIKPNFALLNLQAYNLLMKAILSEKNLVVILFVMVLITFSLAQEDSKKMEKMYSGTTTVTVSSLVSLYPARAPEQKDILPVKK